LRYPLSYRDPEEMFQECGVEVVCSAIDRWVLACAPVIEKRLRRFWCPHCGSVRNDETNVKFRGNWRYLYRAIDKHGNPIDLPVHRKTRVRCRQALLPQNAERRASPLAGENRHRRCQHLSLND
jgi:transposase-like protein